MCSDQSILDFYERQLYVMLGAIKAEVFRIYC